MLLAPLATVTSRARSAALSDTMRAVRRGTCWEKNENETNQRRFDAIDRGGVAVRLCRGRGRRIAEGRRRGRAHALRTQKYARPAGRQKRRLHSGAREGRSEHLRHRAGDDRREGLHGRRRHVGSVDPVDLQSVHDGEGDRGIRPGIARRQHGRRRDRSGLQFDRRDRTAQRRRDEPARQRRRDHRDEHGQGHDVRRRLDRHHRLLQRVRGAGVCRSIRRSTNPKPRRTNAIRRSPN